MTRARTGSHPLSRRPVLAWAFYDWANSAFALTVIAVFYPLFLRDFWSAGDDPAAVTARLAAVSGTASLVVALLAPVLGAIADRGGTRKRFLAGFTVLAVVMTGSLAFVEKGQWPVAVALYLFAAVGYYSANSFYDSLIVNVARPREYEQVSAFGFALGYFGSAMLFAFNAWMVASPERFGLADAGEAVRIAFLTVAGWWALFALPVFVFVPRDEPRAAPGQNAVVEGYRQLVDTFRDIRAYRQVFLFLLAYWLYIDGVHTVIQMAVDYGRRLGFDQQDLITALLITNFVGFPATLGFAWLGPRIGPKRAIYLALAVYISVTLYALVLRDVRQFYVMAIVIGMVQGGVQSMSRALYAALVPPDKAAEFFGFYAMLGKFAAVLGPLLIVAVSVASDDPRLQIFVLLPLFVIGGALLSRVRSPGREAVESAAPLP